jgi:hypothetical protein
MRCLLTLTLLLSASPALADDDPVGGAREAFVDGAYHKAIDLARLQIAAKPEKAWRLIGGSSCYLKDKSGAKEAYSHLSAKGQSFVSYVCSRNAIVVP